jgi:uncharacterized small protein (DUF1192 family)
MSRKKLTYKDFKAYFSNNLQSKAKHDFEKEMMRDAFDEEAFDGLSLLSNDELENDISELKSEIKIRTKKTRTLIPVWFKYAASILILIGVGLSVLLMKHNLWQDTVLKEQISEEMQIADSIIQQAESEIKQITGEPGEHSDSTKAKDFVADNRQKEKQSEVKKPKADEKKIIEEIVAEQDLVPDELVLETEVDEDTQIDILEFEEVEAFVVIADRPESKNENKVSDEEINEVLSEQASGVRIEKKEEENRRIVIRGASSLPSKKSKQAPAVAEGVTIKGKVIGSEDDLSIPGVSIVFKENPTIGTTTNIDGEFTLTIPESDEELRTLIAFFVGMTAQEIILDGDSNLLVYMESDVLEMDEVVVTAYGVSEESEYLEPEYKNARPSDGLSLRKYKNQITHNLDYSKLAEYSGTHKIKVVLRLNSYGTINEIEFKKSPNIVFDQEIERVMRNQGPWKPAVKNGEQISTSVRFTLKLEIE